MTVSQATLDLINRAEDDLAAAKQADVDHQSAQDAADAALKVEADKKDAADTAHRTAVDSASKAVDALKVELGLEPPPDPAPTTAPPPA